MRVSGTVCLDLLSLIEVILSKINILSLFSHPHVLTNLDAVHFFNVPQIKYIVVKMGFEQNEGDFNNDRLFILCMLMDVCYSL